MSELNPQMASTAEVESSQIEAPADERGKKERKFDGGFLRNLKVVGLVAGIAVLATAIVLFRFFSESGGSQPQSSIEAGNTNAQTTDSISPKLQQMHAEGEREAALAAARRGESYVPTEPGVMRPIEQVAPGDEAAVAYQQQQPMPAYVQVPQNMQAGIPPQDPVVTHNMRVEAEIERNQRRMAGLARQMGMLAEDGRVDGVRQVLIAERNGNEAAASQQGGNDQQAQVVTPAPKALIAALKVVPGQMENVVRVDEGASGYASASITAGPLAGAFLVGQAQVVNSGELSIVFNRMSFQDEVYSINARVMDEDTANQAIAGKVDHRVLQRYVLPVLMAAAQGYYDAKSQVGTSVVSLGVPTLDQAVSGNNTQPIAGSTAQQTVTALQQPAPTKKQARDAGISEGLGMARAEVDRGRSVPINVRQERGFPIGIMFMDAVYPNESGGARR